MKKYLSLSEVARMFGVSNCTVSGWARKGLLYAITSIDVVKGGKLVFFKARDVKFLYNVFKSLPPDKRRGRHLVQAYHEAVDREFSKGKR